MRTAALKIAGPKPDMIGQKKGDAAFLDTVKRQQGRAGHGTGCRRAHGNRAGVGGFGFDQAEPAAPAGITITIARHIARNVPGRPRVIGWRRPKSVTLGRKGSSAMEPVG